MPTECLDAPLPKGLVKSIEEFFMYEDTREPGADLYLEIFQHRLMFPLQRQGELAAMMCRARAYHPKTVMEIGTDKAGGLYHWCKCLPSVKNVIACEVRGTPYDKLFERAFPHINFLWLPWSSYQKSTAREVMEWLGMCGGVKIDCLFIDGDKTAFEEDFDTYLPSMSPTSVAFMHDIQDEIPRRGYDAVTTRGYKHEEIVNRSDTEQALKNEGEGLAAASEHEKWLRQWKGKSCGVGCIYLGEML